ncbi:hypothetical protein [Tepidiforma bonchosmolovskayae]|uniref:DUF11 domain-containing protein n=1 Tax=Tepidiforma bonchosmolovskayae TaxID=2601677 RepID=A0ABX6C351_9CHLR|nr:hypothetical protein [Tepidiforma bonchosmolovskayae]QFG03093.1 hypothetical protein Tbon_07225 [Tepidiforma bonchosmolovskayae]
MSKELAQTVGGKRVAWLIAILAAFAVMAALGSQWRGASAQLPLTTTNVTQSPAAGSTINPGSTITYTLTATLTANLPNTGDELTMQIDLPAGVTVASVTCSPPTGGNITTTLDTTGPEVGCNWVDATPGIQAGTYTATITVTAGVGPTIAAPTDAEVCADTNGNEDCDDETGTDLLAMTLASSVGTLNVNGITTNATTAAAGGQVTVTFNIPAGLTYCSDGTGGDARAFTAADQTVTGLNVVSTTPTTALDTAAGTHTVVVTDDATVGGTVSISTHLAGAAAGTGCSSTTVNITSANFVLPQLRHIADNGTVIAGQEVSNNVRGSQHTICTVNPANNQGIQLPVGITLSNIVVTNGGGYASTADTDPTFSDVIINTQTIGGQPATCVTWRSLDAGDQTISVLYVGLDGVQYNVLWNATQGLVKEWNTLEASTITSGTVSGTGDNVSVTRTLPVTLNPVTGQYQGTAVNITDTFLGSHTNSAGQKEGPMSLAGVQWTVTKTGCGTLSGTTSGTTTLTSTGGVGNEPSVSFDPDGCAPGSTATVTITGSEPGALGSGTPKTVTQSITFSFTAQIPAKHVFLAWAGQRVVLEHNWALDPSSLTSSAQTCPTATGFDGPDVQYIKGSGPGNFLPGGTVQSIDTDSEALALLTTGSQVVQGTNYPACTSVAVFESEDQGQVDIEAFIEDAPASKVAWVVYYMKIERVNLSLVTQVSKPTHNGSAAPDWAPGNPWDASKDDADGAAEWNVSKDILVRGRVSGWFVNSNPSGRPADTSNPLNVLPANRWVMPNDWPLLAGGPDGEEAYGTAEQFRPYYDIMIAPNNVLGLALANPDGTGLNLVAVVAAGNTGVGSSTSPIKVTTCASLQANDTIVIGTTSKTVSSCTGTSLVITAPFTAAPAAGTPIFESSGVPFIGPYSALDIVGLAKDGFGGTAPTSWATASVRDTAWKDFDVDWWDAPMPPALVSVAVRGTGFIKAVYKDEVYYLGTPNTPSVAAGGTQVYPNPYYWTEIPESPFISAVAAGGGYLWDSWGTVGPFMRPYPFWKPVRIGVNSAGIGEALSSTDIAELTIIRNAYNDQTIARDLVVYSDNHGEFMVAANGDFKTDLSACATNALAGGKHCKPGDKVGKATITATADYPDFRGKHFPVASNAVTVDWTWGGYKDVTIEKGETDQFVYVVFHALDRDGFCSVPTGAVSLHPVLSSADAGNDFSSLGARYNGDPVENVDFLIDSGEGIIIAQSGGGAINDGKRFATGVTTFSVAANDPAVTGLKEFPLSPLAAQGQTDECQAWIKVSNSLLGIVNVLAIAHDDEGNIGFDRVIDLQTTTSYTLNFRWSLITWAGANNIPVMDAIKGTGKNDAGNDISASVTAIYGWDAAGQKWLGFFPAGVNVPGANDLNALKTGEAYWIAITGPSSVTWTIATNVD